MPDKRIRGSTPSQRAQARQRRALNRLADMTVTRIRETPTPARRLSYACDHLRAVAARLGPQTQTAMARKVAELADQAAATKRKEESW